MSMDPHMHDGIPPLPATTAQETQQNALLGMLSAERLEDALAHLKSMPVEKDFGQSVLVIAVGMNAQAIVNCLFEEKNLDADNRLVSVLVTDAASRHQTALSLYLSRKAAERGGEIDKEWKKVLFFAVAKDHEVIANRILAAADNKKSALDNLFSAAVQAKTYDMLVPLLEKGANPNVANGMALLDIICDPPRVIYSDHKVYDALLKKVFEHGYDQMGLVDDMLVVSVQKMVAGEQRADTAITLLDNGADPFAFACQAQKLLQTHYAGTQDDRVGAIWEKQFAESQDKETAAERKRFAGFFGGKYNLYDLLQPLGHGETGLMVAARARMLGDVLAKFSTDGKEELTIDDITQKSDRNQSVLTLAADRGDLGKLLEPAFWRGREKQVLDAAFTHLSCEQAALGGFEKLQATHTRDRLVAGLDRKRWQARSL